MLQHMCTVCAVYICVGRQCTIIINEWNQHLFFINKIIDINYFVIFTLIISGVVCISKYIGTRKCLKLKETLAKTSVMCMRICFVFGFYFLSAPRNK